MRNKQLLRQIALLERQCGCEKHEGVRACRDGLSNNRADV
jgi:hypothetical protein